MKFAKIALAAALAATLPASGLAQPREPGSAGRGLKVPCCTCVDGSIKTLNLSTGAVPWAMTGPGASGNAVGLSHPSWNAVSGASWVGPTGGASTAQAGTYTYTVRFHVPRCVIGARAIVKGQAGGDNRITVQVDGTAVGSTPGSTQYGFQTANFVNFSSQPLGPGMHTLSVQVNNQSGPSGMALRGAVEVQCPKEAELGGRD
jgi:hypothetical protein